MQRKCSWLCGSLMAAPELQMQFFHFTVTVMPTPIIVLLPWANLVGR